VNSVAVLADRIPIEVFQFLIGALGSVAWSLRRIGEGLVAINIRDGNLSLPMLFLYSKTHQ
jgi:hypothetical protein